jgi:hypothetical protein
MVKDIAEHRKIEELPPIRLYRKDLIALEKLLKSDTNWSSGDFKIDIGHGYKTIPISTFIELPTEDFPESTDDVSLKIIGWNSEREIENGVSMRFYHNHANYQIHSLNEVWFEGKISQLNSFFKKRKPWYSWLNATMPIIAPLLSWASLFIIFWGYYTKLPWVMFIASALFVSTIAVGWMSFKERLFPYVKVFFSDKPNNKSSYELITLILELAILIATIISIIVPLAIKSK